MNSQNKTDIDFVSRFLSGLVNDMMSGHGMHVNIMDVPKVISAGKRLKGVDGKTVTVDTIRRIEEAHPEIWDLLLVGASELMKERIRRALAPRPEVDATVEK